VYSAIVFAKKVVLVTLPFGKSSL